MMRPAQSDLGRHILVVYAGGTIGMRQTENGFAPQTDLPSKLAEELAPLAGDLPCFRIEALAEPIDSAEATPADWAAMARFIAGRSDDFDGFVVLHGTDTMAYTASALSFLLCGLAKPVILTGSQIPLDSPNSDALGNVAAALTFAAFEGIAEVGLAFDGVLYRGNRSTKVSTTAAAAFDSPNHPPLAKLLPSPSINPAALWHPQGGRGFVIPDAIGEANVMSLRLTPGMPPARFDAILALAPRALILEAYGGGTVPSVGGGLSAFLRRAADQGMIVMALSQVPHGGTALGTYAAGSALLDFGVIDGRDMTFEAAYAKLHCCLATAPDAAALREVLSTNLCGECRG